METNFNGTKQADGTYEDALKRQEKETEANKREQGMRKISKPISLNCYFRMQIAFQRLVLEGY